MQTSILDTAVFANDCRATRRLLKAPLSGAFETGRVEVGLDHFRRQSPEYREWLARKRQSKARWFRLVPEAHGAHV